MRQAVEAFANKWNIVPAGRGAEKKRGNGRSDYVNWSVFEAFAVNLVLNGQRNHSLARSDVLSLVTGGSDDSGIDAIAILVNGGLITSAEDLAIIDETDASDDLDVEFVFVQATLVDKPRSDKLDSFATGVGNFFSASAHLPENDNIVFWRGLKDRVLGSLEARGGSIKPRCRLYFVWPGDVRDLSEQHRGILDLRKRDLDNCGLFRETAFEILDVEAMLAIEAQRQNRNSARLTCRGVMPASPTVVVGADEPVRSWLAEVRAEDLMAALVTDGGALPGSVFYENVRHYLGDRTGSTNANMRDALRSGDGSGFHLLNNGVTVVARGVEVVGERDLVLTDFQIVNGCQTTHVLHANRTFLTPDVSLTLRVVETEDRDLMHRIVVATNSQTQVDTLQLMSREPTVRRLQ